MAKNNKADMSCARVKKYTASDVSKAERHNERKNETYENMNVIEERIPFNVHFKTPTAPTYMEQLKQMETDGLVSLRGLRKDATIFNEIVIDVNTMYFERNGGYEYAKQFYEEAFHFIEEKFGAENVISAVMHADEINIAATEELGKEVYHYGEAHQKCAGPLLGLAPGDGADPAEDGSVRDGQSQRVPAQDGDRRLCAATGFAGAEGAGEPAAPVQQQPEPAHPPRP